MIVFIAGKNLKDVKIIVPGEDAPLKFKYHNS